ncbi:biotin synthetase [Escherichia coli]|nr:biotin synthetase [Escherichia coli]
MAHRPRWTLSQVTELFEKPLLDLLFEAQQVHRQHFDPRQVQVSTLLSIKTGACPEDCKYCPQSSRYKTGLEAERLMEVEQVLESARKAKAAGSTRFCMGAAWKNPHERDMPYLEQMVQGVKAMGLEACMTLGTLSESQAQRLANAGLDYYNHNLDTSPEFYGNIITTRTYQERLDTLEKVREAGIKVCSGGIVGLGETVKDRAGLLLQLANLPTPPESVPINMLVKVKGTPLADNDDVDAFDFIRTIAVARIMMPTSYVRLSAGREQMNEQTQAMCFMAGANSIFYGCKLLTTPNPEEDKDLQLFRKLGLNPQQTAVLAGDNEQQQRLEQALMTPDTDEYYNAAALWIWQEKIDAALDARRVADALRRRYPVAQGAGRWLVADDCQYLNFSSNDYLGLSHHPQIIRAWQQGAEQFGVGSGGSGHVSGYSVAHQVLEEELAEWLGYSRALLFISGFAANQAVIAAMMAKEDRIVADRLSHASLLEAASLSPSPLRRFAHNDVTHLARLLASPCPGQQLVVTEGVFSMDGDSAPLEEIQQVTQQHDGWLMVDDAHGTGVIGEQGRGSCWLQKVKPELLVVTFGKGFGVSGAAVLCSNTVADYLLQFARHLIYSTSMPPAQAQALRASLAVIRSDEGDARREKLAALITRFRAGVQDLPFTLADSWSAIQPLIVGDNSRALQLAEKLRQQGCWVTAIRPPTVPAGTARLRLTLTAAHEMQDIDRLLEVLHGNG